MATIKSYTDIEQSRKLAEILPLESADMYYCYGMDVYTKKWDYDTTPTFIDPSNQPDIGDIPCWSLAALLDVLPKEIKFEGQHYAPCLFPVQDKWLLKLWYNSNYTITSPISIFSDNPTNACVAMILKLHEQ